MGELPVDHGYQPGLVDDQIAVTEVAVDHRFGDRLRLMPGQPGQGDLGDRGRGIEFEISLPEVLDATCRHRPQLRHRIGRDRVDLRKGPAELCGHADARLCKSFVAQ